MSRVGANANDVELLFAENPTLDPIAQLTLIDCEKALYDSFVLGFLCLRVFPKEI